MNRVIGLGIGFFATFLVLLSVTSLAGQAAAQGAPPKVPDLAGTYRAIPNDFTLAGGLRNQGSPEAIRLLPAAAERAKTQDLKTDPANNCQLLHPFRVMARDEVTLDILPVPSRREIYLAFEEYHLGLARLILLDRPHDARALPSRTGSSVGRWEADTLVVETRVFVPDAWLNSAGAIPSDVFRLTERYRLMEGGKFLEVKVTAEDAKVLTAPYTYTRYLQRIEYEIPQLECNDNLLPWEIPKIDP